MAHRADEREAAARPRWRGYVVAPVAVALATAIGLAARGVLATPDLVALYLGVILLVALRSSRGPATVASAASVLAYDFFFIEPRFTFAVTEQRNLLTFGLMFAVGQIVSQLAIRSRSADLAAQTEAIRNALLSAVSHDLRTPLASITGAATALEANDAALSAAQRAELIGTICDEARRLERQVTNLLDMTRFEAGRVVLRRDWVPLEEIVGAALEHGERALAGHAVTVDLAPDLPLLSVDPVLVEHLLVNLLENAAKYGDASPITLRGRAVPDWLVVEVLDRGPGVPPALTEAIFDKFVRAAPSGVPGVGLGLPIARAIARAHGGNLTVQAREGGGARFIVRLPLAPAPSPPVEEEA